MMMIWSDDQLLQIRPLTTTPPNDHHAPNFMLSQQAGNLSMASSGDSLAEVNLAECKLLHRNHLFAWFVVCRYVFEWAHLAVSTVWVLSQKAVCVLNRVHLALWASMADCYDYIVHVALQLLPLMCLASNLLCVCLKFSLFSPPSCSQHSVWVFGSDVPSHSVRQGDLSCWWGLHLVAAELSDLVAAELSDLVAAELLDLVAAELSVLVAASLGARSSKNRKGGSGTSAGVEVYTTEC